MNSEDIERIERELSVRLPDIYRQTVSPFPIPALAGNADTELWDDPTRLIALNRELRAGDKWRKPWPEHLFAVGEMDGESYVAIDLRQSEAPTWWADHGHLDNKGSGQTHARFEEWVSGYIRDLRSDLAGDGHNPDGTPEQLATSVATEARQSFRGYVVFLALLVIVIVAWLWLR
jgi:hypothetical protein